MKELVLLGGSRYFVPVIKKAYKLGLYVIIYQIILLINT